MARLSKMLSVAWHVAAIGSCWYGFRSLELLTEITGERIDLQYGGHLQFLTICGLAGTLVTVSFALLLDLVRLPKPVLLIKDLLTAMTLPTELLISILYWSLFFYNKDLLMPPKRIMDPANPGQVLREESITIPFPVDASMHALPGVFLLVDFLFFSRQMSRSIRIAPLAVIVAASYAVWVEKCAQMNGHFPYPLLQMLNLPQRIALYAASGVVAALVGQSAIKVHAGLDHLFQRGTNSRSPTQHKKRQ